MTFKFNNTSREIGRRGDYNWYEWKLYMDEPEEKLKDVESVEYRLHETFPNPIRIEEDPKSRFALNTSGWGEFTVYITVHLKDGTKENTRYELDLEKPP